MESPGAAVLGTPRDPNKWPDEIWQVSGSRDTEVRAEPDAWLSDAETRAWGPLNMSRYTLLRMMIRREIPAQIGRLKQRLQQLYRERLSDFLCMINPDDRPEAGARQRDPVAYLYAAVNASCLYTTLFRTLHLFNIVASHGIRQIYELAPSTGSTTSPLLPIMCTTCRDFLSLLILYDKFLMREFGQRTLDLTYAINRASRNDDDDGPLHMNSMTDRRSGDSVDQNLSQSVPNSSNWDVHTIGSS